MGVCCSNDFQENKGRHAGTKTSTVIPVIRIHRRLTSLQRDYKPKQSPLSAGQAKTSKLKSSAVLIRAHTLKVPRQQLNLRRADSLISRDASSSFLTLQYSQSDVRNSGPGSSMSLLDLVTPLQSRFHCSPSHVNQEPLKEADLDDQSESSEEDSTIVTRAFKKTYCQNGQVMINQYVLHYLITSFGDTTVHSATAGSAHHLLTTVKTHTGAFEYVEALLNIKHRNIVPLVEVMVPYCNSTIVTVQKCVETLNVPLPANLVNFLAKQLIDAVEYLHAKKLSPLTMQGLVFLDCSGHLQVPWTLGVVSTPTSEVVYNCAKMIVYLATGADSEESKRRLLELFGSLESVSFEALREHDWSVVPSRA